MQLCQTYAGKLALLESSIVQKRVLELTNSAGEVIHFLPLKVLELAGEVTTIGEDIFSNRLIDIVVEDIEKLTIVSSDFKLTFTRQEVDFYIKKLREVEGVSHRLVLKVGHSISDLGHPGRLQHLGTPYMTTNMEGDLIWAATVEVNSDLFEWLFALRNDIVILDPTNIKEEFETYCHYRENKGA
jgi:hypothetical protein